MSAGSALSVAIDRARLGAARLLAPAWPAHGDERTAFFAYAKSKTVAVEGAWSHPTVDAVVLARRADPHRVYQFGSRPGRLLVPSEALPYRIGALDVLAALVGLDRSALEEYRMIRRINGGLSRQWIPWRSYLLWNLRTLLIARAVAGRMADISRAHAVAYVTDFYSAVMLGVTLAFRRRGKPVWDIQHGRVGPGHQAYNRGVFRSDCEMLPTGIVVWNRATGEYVARELRVEWVSTEFAHLRLRAQARQRDPRGILYSLQVDTPLPDAVIALIRREPSWSWRLRPHPGGRNPDGDVAPLLALANVSLSEAGTPLEDDVLAAAVHVTWNSSVVSEAAALGVPSVLMDEAAIGDFAHEVDAGLATYAPPERLESVLGGLLPPDGTP